MVAWEAEPDTVEEGDGVVAVGVLKNVMGSVSSYGVRLDDCCGDCWAEEGW